MKGPTNHAHAEAAILAIVVTGLIAVPVSLLGLFGLAGATPLVGLPWWCWLFIGLYLLLYLWRRRAWGAGGRKPTGDDSVL